MRVIRFFYVRRLLVSIPVLVFFQGHTVKSMASEEIRMVTPSNACHATFRALSEIGVTADTKEPGAKTILYGTMYKLEKIPISKHIDSTEYQQDMHLTHGKLDNPSKVDPYFWKRQRELSVAPGKVTTEGLYINEDLERTSSSIMALRNSMKSEHMVTKVIFGKHDILKFISGIKENLVQESIPIDKVGKRPSRELAFPDEQYGSTALFILSGMGSIPLFAAALGHFAEMPRDGACWFAAIGGLLVGCTATFILNKRNSIFLNTHLLIEKDYHLEPRLRQIEGILQQTGRKAERNQNQRIYFEVESPEGVKLSMIFDNHVTPQLAIYGISSNPNWWQDTLADNPSTKQDALPVATQTPKLPIPKLSLREQKQLFKKRIIAGYAKSIENFKRRRRNKSNKAQILTDIFDIESFSAGVTIKDLSDAPVIRISKTADNQEKIEVYTSIDGSPKQWINIDRLRGLSGQHFSDADISDSIEYFESGLEEPADF